VHVEDVLSSTFEYVYLKDSSQFSNDDNIIIIISNITFSVEADIINYFMTINDTCEILPTPIKSSAAFKVCFDKSGNRFELLGIVSSDIELHTECDEE